MATASQITQLLESHNTGDDERFCAVALQVAASEARKGHSNVAKQIRSLVERTKIEKNESESASNISMIAEPRGDAAELFDAVVTDFKLSDLVLPKVEKDRIRRILKEQHHLSEIRSHNLPVRQRLLLTGPPGCGKTMCASILSNELGLPLFVIRLDSLISRHLGESLSKIRLIFDTINQSRAVYLFDEFDSVGFQRDSDGEVGEMRRLLNLFLTYIENLSSNSLVVAATNHGDKLDNALYRRFDDLVEFKLPDEEQIQKIIEIRLASVKTSRLSWVRILKAAHSLSYAEIIRACDEAMKEKIIFRKKLVTTPMITDALKERRLYLDR